MRYVLAAALVATTLAACGHAKRGTQPASRAEEPRAPSPAVGSHASALDTDCQTPLSLITALRRSDSEKLCVDVYLVMLPQPCPPCPAKHTCEACLPPFAVVGDHPPDRGGITTWADGTWASLQEGAHIRIVGSFEPSDHPGVGRVLRARKVSTVGTTGMR